MNERIAQQRNATRALAAKRGEISSTHLTYIVRQMVTQLTEEELRDISLGKTNDIVKLKPLPKRKVKAPAVLPPNTKEIKKAVQKVSRKKKKMKPYTKPELVTKDIKETPNGEEK